MSWALVTLSFSFVALSLFRGRFLYFLVLFEYLLLGVFFVLAEMSLSVKLMLGVSYMTVIACEAAVGLSVLVNTTRVVSLAQLHSRKLSVFSLSENSSLWC